MASINVSLSPKGLEKIGAKRGADRNLWPIGTRPGVRWFPAPTTPGPNVRTATPPNRNRALLPTISEQLLRLESNQEESFCPHETGSESQILGRMPLRVQLLLLLFFMTLKPRVE